MEYRRVALLLSGYIIGCLTSLKIKKAHLTASINEIRNVDIIELMSVEPKESRVSILSTLKSPARSFDLVTFVMKTFLILNDYMADKYIR
jgi:hypothetical protein